MASSLWRERGRYARGSSRRRSAPPKKLFLTSPPPFPLPHPIRPPPSRSFPNSPGCASLSSDEDRPSLLILFNHRPGDIVTKYRGGARFTVSNDRAESPTHPKSSTEKALKLTDAPLSHPVYPQSNAAVKALKAKTGKGRRLSSSSSALFFTLAVKVKG